MMRNYDVVVVGAGHAGVEAALASARLGCRTIIVTQNLDTIGQMSCNPAIGGPAKSHLVREIDALGGAMAFNADATGIQFRTLNRSKGAAVWATRIQCDKRLYQTRLKQLVEETENLECLQCSVRELSVRSGRVCGVDTDIGLSLASTTTIITAGTFLRAILHVGAESKPGGRMGDAVSNFTKSIKEHGVQVGRFKTGTPCRINSRSVDYREIERQDGEDPAPRLSDDGWDDSRPVALWNFKLGMFHVEQLPCWITSTTAKTAEIITRNLNRSPLYSGQIQGFGPRYCPSIEDKVVRFPSRQSHHVFLEPEGRNSYEMYVNGVSTSLPFDVQREFVRSIRGLERCQIVRPGYAVEYDYFPPTQLHPSLESKVIENLFFAGQVNGTSGYEEAAAQGLIAGANAALKSKGEAALSVSPQTSYIGVLLADLTVRGTDEPYRMFTSRAADRLALRQDNAADRMTPLGIAAGLVPPAQQRAFEQKQKEMAEVRQLADRTFLEGKSLAQAMRSPQFAIGDIPTCLARQLPASRWQQLIFDLRYQGYIARQRRAARVDRRIPLGTDFGAIPSLRAETRQKLMRLRPTTLENARHIPGLTEADLSILDIWLARHSIPS